MKQLPIYLNMLLALGLAPAGLWSQGSLTPPSGVPGPLMKTLQQIEPRVDLATLGSSFFAIAHEITEPGAYYLSGNMEIDPSANYGILVSAHNVTIDLGGFKLSSFGGLHAIFLGAGVSHVTILNGQLDGFERPIEGQLNNSNVRLENLSVLSANYGATLGDNAVIDSCLFSSNGGPGQGITVGSNGRVSNTVIENFQGGYGIIAGHALQASHCVLNGCGITTGDSLSLHNCTVRNSPGNGLYLTGAGHLIADCIISDNGGTGIGISSPGDGKSAVIRGCVITGNLGGGIYTDIAMLTVDSCDVSKNSNNGIYCAYKARIRNTTVSANTSAMFGIYTGAESMITDCEVRGNIAYSGLSSGIYCYSGSLVRGCVSSGNINYSSPSGPEHGCGIRAAFECTIEDCETDDNTGDGILVLQECSVSRCRSSNNGDLFNDDIYGAGVHATGSYNSIRNCETKYNDAGIFVESYPNLIANNWSNGNSANFGIAAFNNVGTIYSSGIGASDTWANYQW